MLNVIETYKSDVAGHTESTLAQCFHRSNGSHVANGKNRSWKPIQGKHLQGGAATPDSIDGSAEYELPIVSDPTFRKRLTIAFEAIASCRYVVRLCEMRNSTMAYSNEVFNKATCAGSIVTNCGNRSRCGEANDQEGQRENNALDQLGRKRSRSN